MFTMSSKSRIQSYLKQNRISELFEEMMSKIVHDLPSQPISYLVDLLQKKYNSKKVALEVSSSKPAQVKGSPVKSRSSAANLWSDQKGTAVQDVKEVRTPSPSTTASKTGRQYNKPWLTHSKKASAKDKETNVLSRSMPASSKLPWDRTTNAAGDFNQTMTDGAETTPVPAGKNEEDVDLGLVYAKPKMFGKPRSAVDDGDAELKSRADRKEDSINDGRKPGKVLNKRQSKKLRQQKLRELAGKENKSKLANVDDAGDSEDDAIELCEDIDDLRSEGVKSPPKTGVYRSSNATKRKEEIEVVLNMSKFFDSLGGVVSPTLVNEQSREVLADDEDDFESASQVTGPRRPVWEAPESEVDSALSRPSLLGRRDHGKMFDLTNSTTGKPKSRVSVASALSHEKPIKTDGKPTFKTGEKTKEKAKSQLSTSYPKPRRGSRASLGSDVGRARSVAGSHASGGPRSARASVDRTKPAS